MADRPKLAEALESVLGLTYPPTTLSIDTPKAAGHRLAKAVVAKGNLPTRPVSLVDGLAVIACDVLAEPSRAARAETGDEPDLAPESTAEPAPEDSQEVISGPLEPVADDGAPAAEDEPVSDADGGGASTDESQAPGTVRLTLRPFPPTNRLEDALVSGQAIAVPAGGEVPRGGELVYPFSAFTAEVENAAADPAAAPEEQQPPAEPEANGPENDENGDLPVAEPARDWDLVARFQQGEVELPRLSGHPHPNMVGIGAWGRSREVLLPERTILRASDVALLTSLGIDDVKIYRRPVVGVASLGPVFPVAGRQNDDEAENAVCPLSALVVYLARAARVAALPLGLAPMRFRKLAGMVEKWTKQVDILLLVGGSSHGPQCLGLDVLSALGKVQLRGLDLRPGGGLSAGKVGGQPVVVLPGSLPDVLAGFVLLARPLAHKYLHPHLYEDTLQLELACGSQLYVERDMAVPVRYSFDRQRGIDYTRFDGVIQEPWVEYSRGQALVVLEGGRRYADNEVVTGHRY